MFLVVAIGDEVIWAEIVVLVGENVSLKTANTLTFDDRKASSTQ